MLATPGRVRRNGAGAVITPEGQGSYEETYRPQQGTPHDGSLQNALWSHRQATTQNGATIGNATTEKMSDEPGKFPAFLWLVSLHWIKYHMGRLQRHGLMI